MYCTSVSGRDSNVSSEWQGNKILMTARPSKNFKGKLSFLSCFVSYRKEGVKYIETRVMASGVDSPSPFLV